MADEMGMNEPNDVFALYDQIKKLRQETGKCSKHLLDVIADENVNVSIGTMSGNINMESANHVNVRSHDTMSGSYRNGNNGSGCVINLTASTMSGNIHVK